METLIYKQTKLNSINKLTIEIDETFNDDFSIIAYDDENDIWVEKFAINLESAKIIADKLHDEIINNYQK